ncbi:MAG: peptidylprolyl isomerase [Bacteroidetes bacterium]|nr:MAG: peptidylprolyl isomerase [Bacteroidota bacterium]MBL1145631.1 peptidylprolyl isomerase [Bacteroidota bacterium]MCB0801666.1 peptidylprolyl isomerase [Flavobacteriales bacterium]NOG58425.1 peptidylprolyl isomerase [Bacteroidota bacterium]
MKYIVKSSLSLILVLISFWATSQEKTIDEIIAVVGDEIATKAELETKYSAIIAQGIKIDDNTKCDVLEDVLYAKILLNQANLDSVEVSDGQLEGELDRRMRYFIGQIGSEQALEAYYKKPISKIKEELRESLKEQMLIQAMQGNISADLKVTPEEVKSYFNNLPKDSIPLINAEVEVAQIVAYAPTSQKAVNEVKAKLREYKDRVLKGEKFSTLAVLYSEDKGSAVKGGEIGFVGRAEVEPEFSAAAFALKPGQVSPIIKTQFGFHIIELIERRGTKINVRHILLKPKLDPISMEKAKSKLDSIALLIKSDSISFSDAAKKFSEDEDSKKGGGLIVNPYSSTSFFSMDDLDPSLFFVIDKMEEGEMSVPVLIADPRSKPGYRILLLKRRTKPHTANLKDDYQRIKSAALAEKEQAELELWVKNAIERTYIKIDEEYTKGCQFNQDWLKKNKNN